MLNSMGRRLVLSAVLAALRAKPLPRKLPLHMRFSLASGWQSKAPPLH